jgi:hypothetical protein
MWSEREMSRLRMILEREQSQSIYEMAQLAHKTIKKRSVNAIMHKLRGLIAAQNFKDDHLDIDGIIYPAKVVSGYIIITLPDGTQTPAHIFVWEKENGKVPKGYHVHHRNTISTDNRLINLMLMTSTDHVRLHLSGNPPESFVFFSFLQEEGLWNKYLEYRENVIKDILNG